MQFTLGLGCCFGRDVQKADNVLFAIDRLQKQMFDYENGEGKAFVLESKQVEHSLKGKATAVMTVPSPKVKSCKAISVEPEESFVLLTRH